jgi:Tfp pilus assembly protein PilV
MTSDHLLLLRAWVQATQHSMTRRWRQVTDDDHRDLGFTLLEYVFGAVIIAAAVITIITLLVKHFQDKATSVTQQ